MRRRPSYTMGVEWLALNDNAGAPDAHDVASVRSSISVALLADLFDVDAGKVAKDVVAVRARADAFARSMHEAAIAKTHGSR